MQILKLRKFYIFGLIHYYASKNIRISFIHIILISRKKWNSMPNLKKKEATRRLPDHQTGFNGGTISSNKGMSIHLKTFNLKIRFGSVALTGLMLDLG